MSIVQEETHINDPTSILINSSAATANLPSFLLDKPIEGKADLLQVNAD